MACAVPWVEAASITHDPSK